MTVCLTTERLVLRPLRGADATAIASQINDLDITRWLTTVPHPYTLADAESFLANLNETSSEHFGITFKDALIGVVSNAKQLGYWLAKPHWGYGFMTEAASAVVTHHFEQGAAEMSSGYLVGNGASARVLSKLGFEPSEMIESHVTSLGRAMANQQMTLTRKRWEARL